MRKADKAKDFETGSEIKRRRRAAKLMAYEVAKELDVRPETVCRWEKGKHHMGPWEKMKFDELLASPERIATIKKHRREAKRRGRKPKWVTDLEANRRMGA